MRATASTFFAGFLILASTSTHGQGAVPAGGEFQIGTAGANAIHHLPAIQRLADDGMLVVWEMYDPDSHTFSIQGPRYAADGTPLGDQFQIDTYDTNEDLWKPAVTGLADGGFAVLWGSLEGPGDDLGPSIQGRAFAGDGEALGDQFQVNRRRFDFEDAAAAAALPGGGFVAVWDSINPTTFTSSIEAHLFAADGGRVGSQFQVNAFTTSFLSSPAVAILADGRLVVVWRSTGSDSADSDVHGRILNAIGQGLGPNFQLNAFTSGLQDKPAVAALPDGGFIAAWQSQGSTGSDDSERSVQARRFAAGGSPAGEEFQVNSSTSGPQQNPSLAVEAGGGFVVAWESWQSSGSDSSWYSIQGQRHDAAGKAVGGEFQINTHTELIQSQPAVAAETDGGFMVVWHSSDLALAGQRYVDPRFALVGLDGECLDVEGESPDDGTLVDLSGCHGGESQRWRLELTSVPQQIRGIGGRCLLPGVTDSSGVTRVMIGACDGPYGEHWRLASPSHARPSPVIHAGSGLCLDAVARVPDRGDTRVRLLPCDGGEGQAWRPAAEVCTRDSLGPCLNQERFRIDLDWRSFDGTTGSGRVVPAGSDDSGLLWFFEGDNWEMLIKVLDGCAINDRFWVFAAATTTVEYTLRVTDTALGTVREYFNPLGDAAAAITDTGAFATCPAAGTAVPPPEDIALASSSAWSGETIPRQGDCIPDATRMCLSEGRFSVEVAWRDYDGNVGSGNVVPVGSDDSGLFWFFDSGNWEMLVKVLDACHLNDSFLFLGAATTDVEYTLRVTDTDTGAFWEHTNPLGQASEALVHWFETCP